MFQIGKDIRSTFARAKVLTIIIVIAFLTTNSPQQLRGIIFNKVIIFQFSCQQRVTRLFFLRRCIGVVVTKAAGHEDPHHSADRPSSLAVSA